MDGEIDFDLKFGRIKTATTTEKDQMMENQKAEGTIHRTKCYVTCLRDCLFENNLPKLEDIVIENLSSILMDFYPALRK